MNDAVPGITAVDALAAVASGAALVDVREHAEWTAGHAPQATSAPLSEMAVHADELPREGRVVVVCRSGNRSRQIVAWLRSNGVDAVNLEGGMNAWIASGGLLVADHGVPAVI